MAMVNERPKTVLHNNVLRNGGSQPMEDGFQNSFLSMLSVMRRIHDMTGDPTIKAIIDDAERALSRR